MPPSDDPLPLSESKKHHAAALAHIIKVYHVNFGVNWSSSLVSRVFAFKHEIEEKKTMIYFHAAQSNPNNDIVATRPPHKCEGSH